MLSPTLHTAKAENSLFLTRYYVSSKIKKENWCIYKARILCRGSKELLLRVKKGNHHATRTPNVLQPGTFLEKFLANGISWDLASKSERPCHPPAFIGGGRTCWRPAAAMVVRANFSAVSEMALEVLTSLTAKVAATWYQLIAHTNI